MKGSAAKVLRIGLILATLVTLAFALARHPVQRSEARKGLPTDWSHRHVIFSRPGTVEQSVRVQNDPRYLQQQRRHTLRAMQPVNPQPAHRIVPSSSRRHHKHRRGRRMHRDWAEDMGPGAKMGPNMFPAKFSFDSTTANCGLTAQPDFTVFSTGLPGSPTQASIVGYTNLYSGCPSGPIPAAFWAYNTGGQILTSPVLSLDGSQIAFTQTTAGVASVVLLKWLKFDGRVQTPDTLTPVAPSLYLACAAPCMTLLPLVHNDTNSSIFYDYGSDTAYVGDDSGELHQFTTIFTGTPAELVGGGWPVLVAGASLTSPVFDSGSGNVFVGDAGGFLNRVDSTGTVTASGQLDVTLGITDSPILDVTTGLVYVFASDDGAGSAGVFQLATGFLAGDTGTEAAVGASTIGPPVYDGTFDRNYLNSSDASGNVYVCGDPGGRPTLYQVPILAGVMGTAVAGPVVSTTSGATCSPVTDVYNPNISGGGTPTEWVFLSTQAAGWPSGCGGFSCVMNFKVTSWQPLTVYNRGQEILDSNLNIQVADNSGSTSGATPPVWSTFVYGPTLDGTVHWRNQGPLSGPSPATWVANNAYPGAFEIVDSNNNIEISELGGGISGGTMPTWGLAEGDTTPDGSVTWINLGLNPVAALAESGGTSGIIIDNTLNLAGTSQVYFSTLQDQGCFTSGGTGGCAVQASQQGLQ